MRINTAPLAVDSRRAVRSPGHVRLRRAASVEQCGAASIAELART